MRPSAAVTVHILDQQFDLRTTRRPLAYIYLDAAPTGLIPCPTLSLVIGFALLAGGLGSLAWPLVLAAVGLFYGLFGVVRLHVYLDLPLILGASALLTQAIRRSGDVAPKMRGGAPAAQVLRP